jgi:TP901 family phage tail tape measure protein
MPAVQLTIEAQDQATPVLQQLQQTLGQTAPAAQNAGQAVVQFAAQVQAAGSNATLLQQAISQGQQTLASFGQTTGVQAQQLQALQQAIAAAQAYLQTLTTSTQQTAQAQQTLLQTTTQVTQATQGSTPSLLQLGGAIVGLTSALALARDGFGFVKDAVLAYNDASTHINTLIPGQIALQQQYHDILLSIPPVYGDIKTEGEALYRILGANIRDTAQAQDILTAANELAFAGYGKLDSATQLLIRTRAVYGDQVKDLKAVEDVYLQTVQTSGTSLDTFAASFERVLLPAKEAGVSFRDATAAFAVLNDKLKDGSQTTQLLSQFFRALIRDQADFRAVGIDVTKVLSEEGLAGVLKRVQDLTGGNSQAIKDLVPGMRGLEGVSYLVRDGWQGILDKEQQYRDTTGQTKKAIEERKQGLSEEGSTFSNYVQRAIAGTSTYLSFLNQIPGIITGNSKLIQQAYSDDLKARQAALDAITKEREALTQASTTVEHVGETTAQFEARIKAAALAQGDWNTYLAVTRVHLEAVPASFQEVEAAAQALDKALAKLGGNKILDAKVIQEATTEVVNDLETLAHAADVTFPQLTSAATKTVQDVVKQFGYLPEGVLAAVGDTVSQAARKLDDLAATGKATPDELVRDFQGLAQLITKAGFEELPDDVAPLFGRVQAAAELLGQSIPRIVRDMAGQIKIVTDQQLGLVDTTKQVLQQTLQQTVDTNASLLDRSTHTLGEIRQNITSLIQRINQDDLPALPQGFAAQLGQWNDIARRTGQTVYKEIRDALGNVKIVVDETATAVEAALKRAGQAQLTFGDNWQAVVGKFSGSVPTFNETWAKLQAAQAEFGNAWASHLDDMTLKAAYSFDLVSKDAIASSQQVGNALDAQSEDFTRLGEAATRAAQQTDAALAQVRQAAAQTQQDLTAVFKAGLQDTSFDQQFPTDKQGLLKALRAQEQQLANVFEIGSGPGQNGYTDYLRTQTEQTIAILQGKLHDLGVDELGNPLPQSSTSTGTSTTLPRFAAGIDFVPFDMLAVIHQGERVVPAAQNTPQVAHAQAGRDTSGGVTHVTINADISIPVTLPPGMSRIDAQSFVTQITPALQEALDRLQLKVKQLAR